MKNIVLIAMSAVMLSSCSVAMAARKSGASVTEVQRVRTKGDLVGLGAELVSSERSESGEVVEVYKVEKERGSALRSFMHALLDVNTLGLWEVAGTPIESSLGKKKYFSVKVTLEDSNVIKKMELI